MLKLLLFTYYTFVFTRDFLLLLILLLLFLIYVCVRRKILASAQMLPQGLQAAPLAPGALFSKQGTKAFSSAEYAAKSSSFSEILPLHIPESQCGSFILISCIQSFHMYKSLVSEFIFFLVYLHGYDSDHDCIPRSGFLVKSPRTVLDPKSCIPEFLVKLNPKFPDSDVFTRN